MYQIDSCVYVSISQNWRVGGEGRNIINDTLLFWRKKITLAAAFSFPQTDSQKIKKWHGSKESIVVSKKRETVFYFFSCGK